MIEDTVVYFSHKTLDLQIPENVLNSVRNTFSKFEIETKSCGTVTVMVQTSEKELVEKFRISVCKLLKEIEKENSVLARKLARCHGF